VANNERILIEILTTANLSGVAAAQKSFMGLTPAVLGAGLALGAVVVVGKAAIENYKAQEEATNLLEQAYATQNDTLKNHRAEIERFLDTNKRFISDQYDTEAAMASLIRAGYGETEAIRILNDALDWSAIKHQDVSVSATTLIKVLAGNQKALRELGITTDEYNAIMKSTLTIEEKHAALLALIESRTAKGRDTTDQATQSQYALTKAWQDFTAKTGPNVVLMIEGITDAAAAGLGVLARYVDLLNWLSEHGPFSGGTPHAPSGIGPKGPIPGHGTQSFDSGGTVTGDYPGQQVMVQAKVGEHFSMGSSSGAATHLHIHIDRGAFIDGPSIDRLANLILQRARYAPGV
jgi:hypothetical protein